MNQHSGSATLPRGFRYSGYESPKTPEPFPRLDDDAQVPSPPRPRLRLKRRVASSLAAPTQQFLASVAAADVPIPSIEEPEPEPQDSTMGGILAIPQNLDDGDINFLRPRGRAFSPPKTPAPFGSFVPALTPSRYPDWTVDSTISNSSSVESTPDRDYESSRPSTARSTVTSASLFSRLSQMSDDDHCESPGADGKESHLFVPTESVGLERATKATGKARKAPWTKAMSDHLWSTFVLYLQDPKVTPFRMGKSCIPPHGVCLRVAREAKRSWKGSRALAKPVHAAEGRKSGSATPTAEAAGTFIQWPHTCAATRAHLRELCKLKATSGTKGQRILSRSPTPFSQAAARHWNRRTTPARGPIAFATQDMTKSLTLSTAESMQPSGPLAQLTGSSPEPVQATPSRMPAVQPAEVLDMDASFAERRQLGSPFNARSYGPSSSGSLATVLGLSGPMPRRQTLTGPRRTLQSPVRMSRTGTRARRHTQSADPRRRPAIGSDLWLDPSVALIGASASATQLRDAASVEPSRLDDPFMPRTPSLPTLTSSSSMPNVGGAQLQVPSMPPPRLGSPFSASTSNSSHSFPHRMHRMHHGASVDLGMLGRPFATIQQLPNDSSAFPPVRSNLAGRLAYIDQRLKELRQRELNHRSESPL